MPVAARQHTETDNAVNSAKQGRHAALTDSCPSLVTMVTTWLPFHLNLCCLKYMASLSSTCPQKYVASRACSSNNCTEHGDHTDNIKSPSEQQLHGV